MRERLIMVVVGMTIAVIALYGVPRAYFLADLVQTQQEREVDRSATALAAVIDAREDGGDRVDARLLSSVLGETDAARYVTADGVRITAGRPDTDPDSAIVKTRRLDSGRLVVTRDRAVVQEEIGGALEPLVLLGIVLAVLAGVVGFVVAGRTARPFRELAESARALGHGRFDIAVPRRAVPEARAIGTALQDAAARLDELIRREREFAVNASHQLRTPITALRLELEDLTYWEQTSPDVAEHLRRSIGELDRLTSAIDELLDLARRQRHGTNIDVDLASFAADTAQRWRRRIEADGRRLVVTSPGPVPARISTNPVSQVLDVLIENARLHGEGTITLETRDLGTHLAVSVADRGLRAFGNEVLQRGVSSRKDEGSGSGVGLAVASELAEAVGGHLTIDEGSRTTTFVLMLPRPSADGDGLDPVPAPA